MLNFILGFITCFILLSIIGIFQNKKQKKKDNEALKIGVKLFQDVCKNFQDQIQKTKTNLEKANENVNKKYQEEILKNKLKMEEDIKKADEETLNRLKRLKPENKL